MSEGTVLLVNLGYLVGLVLQAVGCCPVARHSGIEELAEHLRHIVARRGHDAVAAQLQRMGTLCCPSAEISEIVATLGNVDTLSHALKVALRVFQTYNVRMVCQPLDHVDGNRHVRRRQDVVKHQRTRDAVGQRLVIFVHLVGSQRIIRRQCSHDDIGTQGGVDLSLAHLLAEAVARQSGINQNTAVGSLDGCLNEQLTVGLAYAVALARRAHQQRGNLIVSKEMDNTFDGFHVKPSVLGDGGYHRHHHAAILRIVHTS